MTRIIYAILISSLFFFSCSSPDLKTININLELENQANAKVQTTIQLIENRLKAFDANIKDLTSDVAGNEVKIQLTGLSPDTTGIRQLLSWDRTMLLIYAINPSSFTPIRAYLSSYIEIPQIDKPYKSTSMIGLVHENDLATVDSIIASSSFRKLFPEVKESYYGIQAMDNKKALFLSAVSSPIINQDMYDKVGGHSIKQDTVGALSFSLNKNYGEKIGQLTGNDSTYLLHIFHDNVYISKIIKPHITDPTFGMEGAFSPLDAKILAALWNSSDIEVDIKINSIDYQK